MSSRVAKTGASKFRPTKPQPKKPQQGTAQGFAGADPSPSITPSLAAPAPPPTPAATQPISPLTRSQDPASDKQPDTDATASQPLPESIPAVFTAENTQDGPAFVPPTPAATQAEDVNESSRKANEDTQAKTARGNAFQVGSTAPVEESHRTGEGAPSNTFGYVEPFHGYKKRKASPLKDASSSTSIQASLAPVSGPPAQPSSSSPARNEVLLPPTPVATQETAQVSQPSGNSVIPGAVFAAVRAAEGESRPSTSVLPSIPPLPTSPQRRGRSANQGQSADNADVPVDPSLFPAMPEPAADHDEHQQLEALAEAASAVDPSEEAIQTKGSSRTRGTKRKPAETDGKGKGKRSKSASAAPRVKRAKSSSQSRTKRRDMSSLPPPEETWEFTKDTSSYAISAADILDAMELDVPEPVELCTLQDMPENGVDSAEGLDEELARTFEGEDLFGLNDTSSQPKGGHTRRVGNTAYAQSKTGTDGETFKAPRPPKASTSNTFAFDEPTLPDNDEENASSDDETSSQATSEHGSQAGDGASFHGSETGDRPVGTLSDFHVPLDPTIVTMKSLTRDSGRGRISSKLQKKVSEALIRKKSLKERRDRMKVQAALAKQGFTPEQIKQQQRGESDDLARLDSTIAFDGMGAFRERAGSTTPSIAGSDLSRAGSLRPDGEMGDGEGSQRADSEAPTDAGLEEDDDDGLNENQYAPQLRYNEETGEMEVIEETLQIDNRHDIENERRNFEEIEEMPGDKRVNSASFSKWQRSSKWTVAETILFYDGLRQFGTDFELISHLFEGRNRRQIKAKWVREERNHPELIDEALRRKKKVNVAYMERMTKLELSRGETPVDPMGKWYEDLPTKDGAVKLESNREATEPPPEAGNAEAGDEGMAAEDEDEGELDDGNGENAERAEEEEEGDGMTADAELFAPVSDDEEQQDDNVSEPESELELPAGFGGGIQVTSTK